MTEQSVLRPWTVLVCAAAASLMLAGCTATRPDADFAAVRDVVRRRVGITPHWTQLDPEDAKIEERSTALLAAPLTADAAVELALLNNRRLQAVYGNLGIARADLVQAGLLDNPVLSADVTLGVSGPGTGVAIGLVQNFVRALQIPLRKRVAATDLEEAKLAVASEVIELVGEVKRAYFRVQGRAQLLDIDRHVVETTRLSADVAERQRGAGTITDLDAESERAQFEDATTKLATDESELTVAREDLNALMGAWGPQTAWTINPTLPLPTGDVTADELESLAIDQRLDLAAAREETKSLTQRLGLTGLPGILSDAQVGIEGERDIDSGIWSLGPLLALPIPLFDQGQAARAKALTQVRQSQERSAALAVDIRAQVRRAKARLDSARSRAEHYHRTVLPLRQRIVERTQLEYNGMLVGVFQLLQAKQAEIDAGRMYTETLTEYWIARADLEQAVGGSLPSSGESTAPNGDASRETTSTDHAHGGAL